MNFWTVPQVEIFFVPGTGLPGANATRRPALERFALASTLLLPLADALTRREPFHPIKPVFR